MPAAVTKGERAEMARLHEAGRSVADIAQLLGRGRLTVREHLAAVGKIRRQVPGGLTDDQRVALVARYAGGWSIRACARIRGPAPSSVRAALLGVGVELRPRGGSYRREDPGCGRR